MATTLSTVQYAALNQAIALYVKGTAPENEFHVDAVDVIAPVAVATGFSPSRGQFHEDCRDRPLTTLIRFVAYIGKP